MSASLQRMLHAPLATIERGGDFYARGTLHAAPPLVEVDGLEALGYERRRGDVTSGGVR